MKPKKFSISKIYSESWEYIKFCRNKIYFIIGIFFVFAIIGYFLPVSQSIIEIILNYIEKILEQTKDLSGLQLIYFIFLNNLQASFIGIIFGIFLGITPIFLAIVNGYVLGFVAALTVKQVGVLSLLNLLPHGIFELSAVFISLGLGLNLGIPFIYRYFKYYSKKDNFLALIMGILFLFPAIILTLIINRNLRKIQLNDFLYRLGNSMKVFLFIVIPLLIIAAIIEGSLIHLVK